jgi:hypothetical protein
MEMDTQALIEELNPANVNMIQEISEGRIQPDLTLF